MSHLVNWNGTAEERFWKYVDKKGDDECWGLRGAIDGGGYGIISVSGRSIRTNRFSYELHNGKIPKLKNSHHGICVCHSCDNRKCVNPKQLFLGTQKQNMQDMYIKKRGGRTKLTLKEVIKIRKMYATNKYTQKDIGNRFGVGQDNISHIINNHTWTQ